MPSLSSSFLFNQIQRRFLNSIHILLPNQKFLINSYWHQAIPGLWPISNKIPRVLHPAGAKAQSHSSRSLILGLWMTFIPYLSGMNDLGLFSLDGHTALAREDQSPSSAPRNKFHWADLSKKLTPELSPGSGHFQTLFKTLVKSMLCWAIPITSRDSFLP